MRKPSDAARGGSVSGLPVSRRYTFPACASESRSTPGPTSSASSSPRRGTVLLLRLARGPAETVAFAVYGGSLVLLYAASTVYHALPLPPERLRPLRTLDHIAIYFLIAGTYTPVAVVTLHGPSGWALLAAAWAIAVAGIPFKIWWLDAPIWLSTGIYLAMGYMALLAAAPLAAAVSVGGLMWLVAGGCGLHDRAPSSSAASDRIRSRASSGTTRSGTCSCWSGAGATSPSSCCTWPRRDPGQRRLGRRTRYGLGAASKGWPGARAMPTQMNRGGALRP